MKYFAKITQDYWVLKNRANEQARKVAQEMDSTLLNSAHDRSVYLLELNKGINQVNDANPRCKPLVLEIHGERLDNLTEKGTAYAYINGNFHITIYPVKHE